MKIPVQFVGNLSCLLPKNMSKVIAIIGGGAAGMMAAYNAKVTVPENKVILLERNSYLGAKVIISGGGRCNVTTGIQDVKEVLKNYPRGAEFLRTAIYNFPPEAVMNFFEALGVPLKIEADLRVFPVSNNGKEFVQALEQVLKDAGVEIMLKAQVSKVGLIEIPVKKSKFWLELKDGKKIETDVLIVTTGGQAYRHTGSTGDGYSFAMALGHSLTSLAPSLNSFLIQESWLQDLAGVAFKKVGLTFEISVPERGVGQQKKYSRSGPILFMHKGVTGPAVFALSALVAFENYSKENPVKLLIDFFPDLNVQELEKKLLELLEKHGGKLLVNVLDMLLPKSVSEKILLQVDIELSKNRENDGTEKSFRGAKPTSSQSFEILNSRDLLAAKVSKILRKEITRTLKAFELTVIGRGTGDEFVTAGGIPLTEIDSKTMQSKICSGLFMAGEILDIDGFTGGFNLQASWATGALAGMNAVKVG